MIEREGDHLGAFEFEFAASGRREKERWEGGEYNMERRGRQC